MGWEEKVEGVDVRSYFCKEHLPRIHQTITFDFDPERKVGHTKEEWITPRPTGNCTAPLSLACTISNIIRRPARVTYGE